MRTVSILMAALMFAQSVAQAAPTAPAKPTAKPAAAAAAATKKAPPPPKRSLAALAGTYNLAGLFSLPGMSDLMAYGALKAKYPTLGTLVDLKKLVADYNEAVKEGKVLPGQKQPSDLADDKCDAPTAKNGAPCFPPTMRYQMLLPEVSGFITYAWGNQLGNQKPALDANTAVDLLYDFGCKAISRHMPGYARVIELKPSGQDASPLVGRWEAPLTEAETGKPDGDKNKVPKSPGLKTDPTKDPIELCIVTHRQLEATLRRDLKTLVGPYLGKKGVIPAGPAVASQGVDLKDGAWSQLVTKIGAQIRLGDGKDLFEKRVIDAKGVCSNFGGKPELKTIGKKKIAGGKMEIPLQTIYCHMEMAIPSATLPRCNMNMKAGLAAFLKNIGKLGISISAKGQSPTAAPLAPSAPKAPAAGTAKAPAAGAPKPPAAGAPKPPAAGQKAATSNKTPAPRQLLCSVNWPVECQRKYKTRLPMRVDFLADKVLCKPAAEKVQAQISQVVRQMSLSSLGAGYGDLQGETLSMVSDRLFGFYRKGGSARLFEQYIDNLKKDDQINLKLPEDSAPAQLLPEVKAQNEGRGDRIRRAVLRRFVNQWTDSYEYIRMTGAMKTFKPKAGAPAAPIAGLSAAPEIVAAVAAAAQQWKTASLYNLYRFTEYQDAAAFWESCTEDLREICQKPLAGERAACARCAEKSLTKGCVIGKDKSGCMGGTIVEPGSGMEIGPWTLGNYLGHVLAMYSNRTASCYWDAARVVAVRFLFGVTASPQDKRGQGTGIGDQAMRYFNSLPLTTWQRCYLFTPASQYKANAAICDGAFDDPSGGAAAAPFEERYNKWIAPALEDPNWKLHEAPLFTVSWNLPEVQATLGAPGDNSCDPDRSCGDGHHLKCTREDAESVRDVLNGDSSGGQDLGQAANGVADGIMTVVGKLLSMLLDAAGMSDMVKTLAKAAGMTPEQSSDCEDPEYRHEQLGIAPDNGLVDSKRGCLTKIFAKNFVDVMESIIVMLGNRLVDWGVDLLKQALQGVKASLLASAGSVPFVGGILATVVDIGWEMLFEYGVKMLLKGLVVSKLPEWLQVKKLSSLPVEKFAENPVLSVILGTVLELIDAAVQYGNKSWLEVGAAGIMQVIQGALAAAGGGSSNKDNNPGPSSARFWLRAVIYAKKDFTAKQMPEATAGETVKELVISMVSGFQAAMDRNLAEPLRTRFDDAMTKLKDNLRNIEQQIDQLTKVFEAGDPAKIVQALFGVVAKYLGPVVVPLVLAFAKLPPWAAEMTVAISDAFTGLGDPANKPTGEAVAGYVARIATPIGEMLLRKPSYGNKDLENAVVNGFKGITTTLGRLAPPGATQAGDPKLSQLKPEALPDPMLDVGLDFIKDLTPVIASYIPDPRLEPERKLLTAAVGLALGYAKARNQPNQPSATEVLKAVAKLLKDYAPARLSALLAGTGLEETVSQGASDFFSDNGLFMQGGEQIFGSPPKWLKTDEAKTVLATIRGAVTQLVESQKAGEGNKALKNLIAGALGLIDAKKLSETLTDGQPVFQVFSKFIKELGKQLKPKFLALLPEELKDGLGSAYTSLITLLGDICLDEATDPSKGKGAWNAFKADGPGLLEKLIKGTMNLVRDVVKKGIPHDPTKTFVGKLFDLVTNVIKRPADLKNVFKTYATAKDATLAPLSSALADFLKDAAVKPISSDFLKTLVGAVVDQVKNIVADPAAVAKWEPKDVLKGFLNSLMTSSDVPGFIKSLYDAASPYLFDLLAGKATP